MAGLMDILGSIGDFLAPKAQAQPGVVQPSMVHQALNEPAGLGPNIANIMSAQAAGQDPTQPQMVGGYQPAAIDRWLPLIGALGSFANRQEPFTGYLAGRMGQQQLEERRYQSELQAQAAHQRTLALQQWHEMQNAQAEQRSRDYEARTAATGNHPQSFERIAMALARNAGVQDPEKPESYSRFVPQAIALTKPNPAAAAAQKQAWQLPGGKSVVMYDANSPDKMQRLDFATMPDAMEAGAVVLDPNEQKSVATLQEYLKVIGDLKGILPEIEKSFPGDEKAVASLLNPSFMDKYIRSHAQALAIQQPWYSRYESLLQSMDVLRARELGPLGSSRLPKVELESVKGAFGKLGTKPSEVHKQIDAMEQQVNDQLKRALTQSDADKALFKHFGRVIPLPPTSSTGDEYTPGLLDKYDQP